MLPKFFVVIPVTFAAVILLGACRGDPVSISPIEDVGSFIATVHTNSDTSASGTAKYHYVLGQSVPGISVTLSGLGGRYSLEMGKDEFGTEPGEHPAGLEPGDFNGTFSVTRGGARLIYRIVGGQVRITELTSRKISGNFSLNGAAIDGSNPGAPALTIGAFTAYCDGDCPNLGGGGTDPR